MFFLVKIGLVNVDVVEFFLYVHPQGKQQGTTAAVYFAGYRYLFGKFYFLTCWAQKPVINGVMTLISRVFSPQEKPFRRPLIVIGAS